MKRLIFATMLLLSSNLFAGHYRSDGLGGYYAPEGHYLSDGMGGLYTPNGGHQRSDGLGGFYK